MWWRKDTTLKDKVEKSQLVGRVKELTDQLFAKELLVKTLQTELRLSIRSKLELMDRLEGIRSIREVFSTYMEKFPKGNLTEKEEEILSDWLSRVIQSLDDILDPKFPDVSIVLKEEETPNE